MKLLFLFLTTLGPALNAYAESIHCNGIAYGEQVYISTHPSAPYGQHVKKACGHVIPLDGDFYFVLGVNPKFDSQIPCTLYASMWELQTLAHKDDGKILEFQLLMCRKGYECNKTFRVLRIDKSTGASSFYNVLDGKFIKVSQSLTCSIVL